MNKKEIKLMKEQNELYKGRHVTCINVTILKNTIPKTGEAIRYDVYTIARDKKDRPIVALFQYIDTPYKA